MEKEVLPFFRAWTNYLLDQRLAGPNKDDPYTVTVDRVAVPGREAISTARSQVTVRFINATVKMALGILSDYLKAAIRSSAGYDNEKIAARVLVFYNGQEIGPSATIDSFNPGDYIMLVPSYITQAYANTKRRGATTPGYMGKAARRIRTKLRINKRDSALTVFAGRSRAAWSKIVDKDGNHMSRPSWGAWAITLRYKLNTSYRA